MSLELLEKSVKAHGQSEVGRRIGYSASAVNQALHGKYKGSLENLLQRVVEVFGTGSVTCPVMGRITIQQCAAERKKPFAASNPQRVRLYRACRDCAVRP